MTAMVARDELKAFISRIENLEAEKKSLSDDVRDVYSEAKSRGYDPKIMRKVIAIRKKDAHERAEEDAVLDVYLIALNMKQPDLFEEAA